jgi:hypothetical protein
MSLNKLLRGLSKNLAKGQNPALDLALSDQEQGILASWDSFP